MSKGHRSTVVPRWFFLTRFSLVFISFQRLNSGKSLCHFFTPRSASIHASDMSDSSSGDNNKRKSVTHHTSMSIAQDQDGDEVEPGSPAASREKRRRRRKNEIRRDHNCEFPGCGRAYGSEGALRIHIKLKHQVTEGEELNSNRDQVTNKTIQGPLDSYNEKVGRIM